MSTPAVTNDAIDLYVRTYRSLLRSTGDVKVRALEEAHAYSDSTLHAAARDPKPDVAAFAYSAGRLPECMPDVQRLVLGQSHEQFEAESLPVLEWERVRTRGRRRPLRMGPEGTLAVFVTSTSDIDDLVPIVTAYQIEWNKLHRLLAHHPEGRGLATGGAIPTDAAMAAILGIATSDVERLRSAFGAPYAEAIRGVARAPLDLTIRLLNGSFSQYQRASHRWWSGIEPVYLREEAPRRAPVYFVSSNSHSLTNLLGGYALAHREELFAFVREKNPENLAPALEAALAARDDADVANLLYYLLRTFIHAGAESRRNAVQAWDAASGVRSVESPGRIDVSAQVIRLGSIKPERLDPRVRVPGLEKLAASDAVIVNIDYPLGMAAYHHLSRVGQGVGDLRGVYVMGKAATLNGRVGDVMLSGEVYDEHSRNTFLFRNCFTHRDVQPWLRDGTVLDGQMALTVRSAFLQNTDYMGTYYRRGYTVLEMEAGPFLSSIYELVNPERHPTDATVHLSTQTPFEIGLLHYASDTPYSRRQELLSKSLSYFGVDSTYACSIAIVRRILENELGRLA